MQTRKEFLRRTVAAGAAIAVPGAVAGTAQARLRRRTADEVKVGMILPLSGVLSLYGKESTLGAQIAASQLNAKGGILGRKVRLIFEDDTGTPAGALAKARKLKLQDRVDFAMGTIASSEREGMIAFAMQNKMPLVYFQLYEGHACDKYLYCTGLNPDTSVPVWAPWLVKNHGTKLYYLGWDYVANQRISAGFKKWMPQTGGEYVGQTLVPFSTTDFAPMLRKAQAAKPDIIYNGMYGSAGFLETLTQLGLKKKAHVTTLAFDKVFLRTLSKPAAANLSWAADWDDASPVLPGAVNKRFLSAARKRVGPTAPVGLDVEAAYVGLLYYAKGIEKAGTLDPDAVSAAMDGLTFDAPSGKLRMSPDNHNVDLPIRVFTSGGTGNEYRVTVAAQRYGTNPNWCKRKWHNS
jgi:urea transport system substrate-binding protein